MNMQVAKDVVDWLQSVGCRVLAYMGGEPLVRKKFIIELTRYATERGFFVYLPTNGILLDMYLSITDSTAPSNSLKDSQTS